VAGHPHAQLGEQARAHIAAMNHSTSCVSPASSFPPAFPAPILFPNSLAPVPSSQLARELRSCTRCGSHTGAACQSGEAAVSRRLVHTHASTNNMDHYLQWTFGKMPAQGKHQPIVGGRAPVYSEEKRSGGWMDAEGTLQLRRHGVFSLPSGALLLMAQQTVQNLL
jgi:hypothetical protein